MFADHFSSVAARYATYRPHYPRELVALLADRCAQQAVAWDAGCGNGQLSVALADRFAQVIATDPSQAQLDAAERHPRVDYRRASAEVSGLAPASVDLAVAAQAAHWFDLPAYVAEVARVARPGALAALASYGVPELPGDANAVFGDFYHRVVGPFWPPERVHVENHYRDLRWPWPAVAAPELAMTASWTREELCGYITTFSATARLVAQQGTAELDAFTARLAAVWPEAAPREIRWPLTLVLARVPDRR
jgi:SAM-dependent methyltransferase